MGDGGSPGRDSYERLVGRGAFGHRLQRKTVVGGVRVDLEFRVLAWHELLLIVPRIALDRRTNGGLRETLVRLRMHIHSPILHHE